MNRGWPTRNSLRIALFCGLSILLHLTLIVCLWLFAYPSIAPFTGGEVEVVLLHGEEQRAGTAPRGQPGTLADPLLAEIRSRIERAKRYPLLARKFGLQGRTLVAFRIDEGGSPRDVTLKSPSGSEILDEEALQTIRRAAPYPAYPAAPLKIWIRFELKP